VNCDDSSSNTIRGFELIEANLTQDEKLVYSFGHFGDEEGARIKKQAQNAELSDLEYGYDGAVVIHFVYKPKPGFNGKDLVWIEINRGSDGESPAKMIELILFVIEVE
jgi:hypothetical protein